MRREKSNAGKIGLLVALIVAVVGGISFGYAKLSETLTINGTAKIKKATWNVNLQNLVLDTENTNMESTATWAKIHDTESDLASPKESLVFAEDQQGNVVGTVTKTVTTGGLRLDFDVTLTRPQQKVTFKFDVANDGTLDAYLKSIQETRDGTEVTINTNGETVETLVQKYVTKTNNEQASQPFFKYTVAGMPTVGSDLNTSAKKTVTITLEYPELSDAESLYNGETDFTFNKTIKLNYEQK